MFNMTQPKGDAAALLADLADALVRSDIEVVDLTRTLSPSTPVFPLPETLGQTAPFRMTDICNYDEKGPDWVWRNVSFGEHTGTHFDAPVHWISGRDQPNNTLDTIPVQRFVARACVLDFSKECTADADFLLEPGHIIEWEARHGKIPEQSWVLLRSDWSLRGDTDAFLNLGPDGAHSPGPSPETVKFLIEERNVLGYGTECVGTDYGQAFKLVPPFPAHFGFHGANRYGLASLSNLDKLPPHGAVLITPPLKFLNGTGSPCRVLALVAR
jgi:kynurenine formamidase